MTIIPAANIYAQALHIGPDAYGDIAGMTKEDYNNSITTTLNSAMGKEVDAGDAITAVLQSGKLRVNYQDMEGYDLGEDSNGNNGTGGTFSVNARGIHPGAECWKVVGCDTISRDDGWVKTVIVSLKAAKKAEKTTNRSDKKDDDEGDKTPFINNPDAISATYYSKNKVKQVNAILGKQKQSDLAEGVFRAAVPAGWKWAFSMSMSVDGKNEYSLKDGTIELIIPNEYQKAGRQFAILAMDKSGNVIKLDDMDKDPNKITVSPNVEGYAYVLIYTD